MSDTTERDCRDQDNELVLEYEFDAPPDKVWRAVTVPALRERWLPGTDLANAEPLSSVTGEEVSYRLRDTAYPHRESSVTFRIEPNESGGTRLNIVHRIAPLQTGQWALRAANSNRSMMRAA